MTWYLWLITGAAACWLLTAVQGWLAARYEITVLSPWRLRVTRRWYGPGALVRLRARDGRHDPGGRVFEVAGWTGKGTEFPWVLVRDGGGRYAHWYRMDEFAPHLVRRFGPYLAKPPAVSSLRLIRYSDAACLGICARQGCAA